MWLKEGRRKGRSEATTRTGRGMQQPLGSRPCPFFSASPSSPFAPLSQEGTCAFGDHCPYAHNVFEYWLHPTRCGYLRAGAGYRPCGRAVASNQILAGRNPWRPTLPLPSCLPRYRTQLCNDGSNCRRKICFFAHRRARPAGGPGCVGLRHNVP